MATTQQKLNKALKDSGGKWTKEVNDLAKQRDAEKGQVFDSKTKTYSSTGGSKSNDNSSGGIKSIGNALKNAPKNIMRDIGMGVGLTKRDADYYRRTANTIARTQGAAAADRYIKQMSAKGGDAAAGVKNADVSGSVNYGQRIGMLNADGSVNTKYMRSDDGGGAVTNEAAEDDMGETYAENLKRYQDYINSQQPQQPQVTPEMRREALNIFESQQGAGQVPYYMAAARNQYNPNMSPAFQYAAQNYDVLGGSQRLAPRSMEMMSVAERGQINDMAQAMADEQARKQAEEAEYRRGMDMVMRGGGKGGPRTGPQMPRDPYMPRFGGKGRGGVEPQIPPMRQPVLHDITGPQLPPGMVGLPRTPDYGGGSPNPIQRSPFASILASRFGGFGG